MTYTFSNAQVASIQTGGKHRSYGMGTVTSELFSTDGVTNPIATSVAA